MIALFLKAFFLTFLHMPKIFTQHCTYVCFQTYQYCYICICPICTMWPKSTLFCLHSCCHCKAVSNTMYQAYILYKIFVEKVCVSLREREQNSRCYIKWWEIPRITCTDSTVYCYMLFILSLSVWYEMKKKSPAEIDLVVYSSTKQNSYFQTLILFF